MNVEMARKRLSSARFKNPYLWYGSCLSVILGGSSMARCFFRGLGVLAMEKQSEPSEPRIVSLKTRWADCLTEDHSIV